MDIDGNLKLESNGIRWRMSNNMCADSIMMVSCYKQITWSTLEYLQYSVIRKTDEIFANCNCYFYSSWLFCATN